jgi:hypothetical protein
MNYLSRIIQLFLLAGTLLFTTACAQSDVSIFSKENITPWCIVPFDAVKRNPQQRAEMLQSLGFTTLAYDWRDEHIPLFDEEVKQLKAHGITMTAFWWSGLLPESPENLNSDERIKLQLDFLKRNGLKLEVWVWVRDPGPEYITEEEKIAEAAHRVAILAAELERMGCRLGIYNHGGWSGMPEVMVAIASASGKANVGIVYNFHHAHEHLELMPEAFTLMLPWLYCVNLNGTTKEGPKILPIGQGKEDLFLLKMIASSGYKGPIGIIGHLPEEDVEVVLKRNLEGLRGMLNNIE